METKEILTYAKIARDTYLNPDKSADAFGEYGFKIIEFFDNDGAEAYLLTNGKERVLSFRGTEIKQKSDVVADLKSGKNFDLNGTKVHAGFKAEVNKVWDEILVKIKQLDKSKPLPLIVTGHSLGAAMATITSSRLEHSGIYVKTLVTFGSPRVGTKEFVKSLHVNHFRVINCCDAVTRVPLYIMGFRHHGTIVYLDFQGNAHGYTGWRLLFDQILARKRALEKRELFSGIYDHFMNNYIYKLKLCVM